MADLPIGSDDGAQQVEIIQTSTANIMAVNTDGSINVTQTLAQGTVLSGVLGSLVMGSVTSSAPTYVNGQISPLGLTTAGDLRVNLSSATARQVGIVTVDALTGRTTIMKTGTIVTTASTADQVVLTYTVTAGKTFYFCYADLNGRLTIPTNSASVLGTVSIESPAGTKLYTKSRINPTTSELISDGFTPAVPLTFAASTVFRVVCTPVNGGSMTWVANFGGYEL
jgi:hypothetical protein